MYFLWGFVISRHDSSCHLLFLLFAKSSSVALPEEACGALALGAATDRSGYVEDSPISPSETYPISLDVDGWFLDVTTCCIWCIQTCPAGAFWGCFLEERVPVSSHLSQVNLTECDWYSTIKSIMRTFENNYIKIMRTYLRYYVLKIRQMWCNFWWMAMQTTEVSNSKKEISYYNQVPAVTMALGHPWEHLW